MSQLQIQIYIDYGIILIHYPLKINIKYKSQIILYNLELL